jgi:hypothetical protein
MTIEAYQRCLNALDVAAMDHDTPEAAAIVASVKQTVRTFLAAEDPSLLTKLLIEPSDRKANRRRPNGKNNGPRARLAPRGDRA